MKPVTASRRPVSRPAASVTAFLAIVSAIVVLVRPPSPLRADVGAGVFIRGEVTGDGKVDISDAVSILGHLFLGAPAPECLRAADANDDGTVQIADAVFVLNFLFAGGPPIPPPYPAAGPDPTPDDLPCDAAAVSSLSVTPDPVRLGHVGDVVQLEVAGVINDAEVDLHLSSCGTEYSAGDRRVAAVYRDGLVEARSPGETSVSVRSGGLERVVRVSVEAASGSSDHTVLAVNDLGMHCMDREFSVFAILPPFNTIRAQVVHRLPDGSVTLLDEADVELRYAPIPDAAGSESSTSLTKTDFWKAAEALFGLPVDPGEGLRGLFMPGDAPAPGPRAFNEMVEPTVFAASGLPLTPYDDAGSYDPYPLMRVTAHDRGTGAPLAHVDVVAPVSQEIDCRNCHATGQIAASSGFIRWSKDADIETQTKMNILTIHDHRSRTRLVSSRPVLCARCHYSAVLDLTGEGPDAVQAQHATLSRAIHGFHGALRDSTGALLFPPDAPPEQTCYNCHPGKQTQCQRGVMRTGGMLCGDCHGGMLEIAGARPLAAGGSLDGSRDGGPRRPWVDMPRCQSCHTGDSVDHLSGPGLEVAAGGLRLRRAYREGDAAASPILARNKRFAENDGVLFRFSKGHGGVLCANCHGSPHAEWPNADPAHNDNVAARSLQGHTGTIIECSTCHGSASLGRVLGGPHGLHPVADIVWIKGHGHAFEKHWRECQACHGVDLAGTVLSRAAADRYFRIEDDLRVSFTAGEPVACDRCHRMPVPGQENELFGR